MTMMLIQHKTCFHVSKSKGTIEYAYLITTSE
jgi:hypothetical protein